LPLVWLPLWAVRNRDAPGVFLPLLLPQVFLKSWDAPETLDFPSKIKGFSWPERLKLFSSTLRYLVTVSYRSNSSLALEKRIAAAGADGINR
jgi:hypothetical protein